MKLLQRPHRDFEEKSIEINGVLYRFGDPAPRPPEPPSEEDIMSGWEWPDDSPLVSVLVHAYNHVGFIEDCLNGILMQKTSFPFEVIVRDDASNDATASIIKTYAERYRAIINPILESTNKFILGVRPLKVTSAHARGKYIAICEADDYWLDVNNLAKKVALLQSNSEISLVGSDAIVISKDGIISEFPRGRINKGKTGSTFSLRRGKIFAHTNVMVFRKSSFDDLPSLSATVNGDNIIHVLAGQRGFALHIELGCFSAYRLHSGGVWSSGSKKKKSDSALGFRKWVLKYHLKKGNRLSASIAVFDLAWFSMKRYVKRGLSFAHGNR